MNMTRLQQEYVTTIVPKLRERLGIDNVMEVPRITKITLNMGVGETITDKKVIEKAVQDMTSIAGQKPQITLARKSVATFKVREGYPVGCKVTLRRASACMSFSIAWSISRFRVSATSVD